jgi:adenosylcobinamide-GDP ribazoletransferase
VKRFLVALQFLTILPVRIRSEITPEDLGGSLRYFPLVGLLLGLALAGAALLLGYLPHPVVAVLVLILSIALTGGIHLDGLADTCDGFGGLRPKEKVLEIMRDSRLGVMGVTGVLCLLALKGVLVASVAPDNLWRLLILMMVFSRWSQVLVCCTSSYARAEGKAKHFVEYASPKDLLAATIFAAVVILFLARWRTLLVLLLSLLVLLLFLMYVKRRIGGVTGDIIGAASEITEVAILFFGLIYLDS